MYITYPFVLNFSISIHAPVKGATLNQYENVGLVTNNFNPRTREGCDPWADLDYLVDADISIHAPVKGATKAWAKSIDVMALFQSTHP